MTRRKTESDLRVPADAFARIRSESRMHERSLDVAYDILVEGKKLGVVADAYGLKKQRALSIRDKVYATYLLQAPPGWGKASICAPEEMLQRFISEAETARLQFWQAKQQVRAD